MEPQDIRSAKDSQKPRHEDSTSTRQGSERTATNENYGERKRMSVLHEGASMITTCMAQILALAGLGQGLAPLHIIGDSFGVNNEGELSWYLAAFSLIVGTFILPAGRLGDLYGHKTIFLIGTVWYGVWSLISGFSVYSRSTLFSVCRGFQGIGPALMVPNALAIAGRSFVGKKKNYVFACFGASAPAGAVLGGVFGATVFFPNSYLILPPDERDQSSETTKPTFDLAGTITGVTGLILFNFAWNQAAVVGWSKPYTYILLVVGMLFFGLFVYIETHFAKVPLVLIESLSREALYALSIIACGWASFGIWVYFFWQLIENLRHHSALSAAAQQSPVALSGLLASLTAGYLFSRFHVAYIMVGAMLCFVTGQILLATAAVSQTYWAQTFAAILVMPWGMDMSFPAGTIILSNGMPREHQGIAASLVNTVVNYSISLSLGTAGTIVRQTDPRHDNTLGSYRNAWYFAIGLDGLGLVIALYFLWISVGRAKVSSQQFETRV
ncbi:related to Drug resistance protein YOR378W [Rhynchosporium secalis]|uniref:Related to Drug resistance protein YOR378W n=1 Tax=Rhynchosporium secalis TaxID=38038 RepID=A0A1E1M606_RHYSE|nr:related to Drug resistance protein YOR378W [Rhynchosporium secalis]